MSKWEPHQVGAMQRMWMSGSSAGQIADALGVSRNAVLGRIRRMGLPRNGYQPPEPTPRPKRVEKPKREMQRLPAMSSLWSLPEDVRRQEIARRAAHAARSTRMEAIP